MSGGGGSSAGNQMPDYIRNVHARMLWGDTMTFTDLTTGIMEAMQASLDAATPYNGETSFNPDTDIATALTEVAKLEAAVDAVPAAETALETRSDKALAVVDESGSEVFPISDFITTLASSASSAVNAATTAIDDDAITDAVASFRTNAEAGLSTRLSQLGGGMADINAVHSSAFALAEAMIDAEIEKTIDKYESDIKLKTFDAVISPAVKAQLQIIIAKHMARDQYISMAVIEMNKLAGNKLDAFKVNALVMGDHIKAKIIAKKEENRENIEMDAKDALWDYKIYESGFNAVAAYAGGTVLVQPEMSPTQSALSGLSSGAASGAMIGSIVPGVGTALGAAIGGGLGLLGGLFG